MDKPLAEKSPGNKLSGSSTVKSFKPRSNGVSSSTKSFPINSVITGVSLTEIRSKTYTT